MRSMISIGRFWARGKGPSLFCGYVSTCDVCRGEKHTSDSLTTSTSRGDAEESSMSPPSKTVTKRRRQGGKSSNVDLMYVAL